MNKLYNGAYKNKLSYPTKPTALDCPKCSAKIPTPYVEFSERKVIALQKFCNGCGESYAQWIVDQYENYEKSKNAYSQETDRLSKQFKKDALEELGLTNHKHKDYLFSKAWERGHSNGLQDVYHELQELAEIVKKLKD